MYEKHPVFLSPKEDAALWRYMDFTKFVSLIDTSSLYFSRSDLFSDRLEGSYPKNNSTELRLWIDSLKTDEERVSMEKAMSALPKARENIRKSTFINCWHENQRESAAMWRLYLKSDEGIAVKSTFKRLRDSITDQRSIYIGKVNYIDYDTETIPIDNLLLPFTHKRLSFEHEREVRAVSTNFEEINSQPVDGGHMIRTDLRVLVESVYVAPGTQTWFRELVISVLKRYGFDFPVIDSDLNATPLF